MCGLVCRGWCAGVGVCWLVSVEISMCRLVCKGLVFAGWRVGVGV